MTNRTSWAGLTEEYRVEVDALRADVSRLERTVAARNAELDWAWGYVGHLENYAPAVSLFPPLPSLSRTRSGSYESNPVAPEEVPVERRGRTDAGGFNFSRTDGAPHRPWVAGPEVGTRLA